jgi:hypothetical protein
VDAGGKVAPPASAEGWGHGCAAAADSCGAAAASGGVALLQHPPAAVAGESHSNEVAPTLTWQKYCRVQKQTISIYWLAQNLIIVEYAD